MEWNLIKIEQSCMFNFKHISGFRSLAFMIGLSACDEDTTEALIGQKLEPGSINAKQNNRLCAFVGKSR